MKIIPLYKLLASEEGKEDIRIRMRFGMGTYPRKTMVLVLEGSECFPVGTPDQTEDGILVFRGNVNHFHTIYEAGGRVRRVEAGWDLDGYAVCPSKRLGAGRRRLRRFLAKYPLVDRNAQAYALRCLVREGD